MVGNRCNSCQTPDRREHAILEVVLAGHFSAKSGSICDQGATL